MNALFTFGQTVQIMHRGEPMDGVITHSFEAGNGHTCYHVRDEYGNYWHRVDHEIKAKAAE